MGTYAGKDKTWPFLLLMVFIMLLILAANYNQTGISEAELVDTDAYMRLVRVEQLAETGDWYDSVIHRSNYPYGGIALDTPAGCHAAGRSLHIDPVAGF